jgi:hypothetical protein
LRPLQVQQGGPLSADQQQAQPPKAPADDDFQEAEAAAVSVGSRCEVEGGKRGVVQYVGRVKGLPLGYWVGVQVGGSGACCC